MSKKTNALRLLDQAGIAYQLREYTIDPDDLSAITVAHKLGLEPAQTFKTLAGTDENRNLMVACIPGDAQLDLKAWARLAGCKRIELLPLNQLQAQTGYVRGGVSPLGLKKPAPVFLDELAWLFDPISISPGQRGLQVLLHPDDLQRVSQARVGSLCRY